MKGPDSEGWREMFGVAEWTGLPRFTVVVVDARPDETGGWTVRQRRGRSYHYGHAERLYATRALADARLAELVAEG